ncbi:MAG: dynamin family protein, partial [Anaerolineae bacterium]|nr:dynamin family protein [Anaerolineae bacterium]
MAAENLETKLVADYEAIRRREYELITDLLDVLPKVDNLPEERVAQVRDALFHADHPYLMVLVGPYNSGKSSLINALLGKPDLLHVGVVPTTDRVSILRWGEEAQTLAAGGEVDTVFYPSPLLKKVSLVDTPGLESVFQKHEEITRKFLHRADVVLLVMLATQAMTAGNLEYLQRLREYGKKVIIVINQADLLSPEEQAAVRQYVADQSKALMGFEPEIWMVSAKQGLEAQADGVLEEAEWAASGLPNIVNYVDT